MHQFTIRTLWFFVIHVKSIQFWMSIISIQPHCYCLMSLKVQVVKSDYSAILPGYHTDLWRNLNGHDLDWDTGNEASWLHVFPHLSLLSSLCYWAFKSHTTQRLSTSQPFPGSWSFISSVHPTQTCINSFVCHLREPNQAVNTTLAYYHLIKLL